MTESLSIDPGSAAEWIADAVSGAIDKPVQQLRRSDGSQGGYTTAHNVVAEFVDGTTAFVKAALDGTPVEDLRHEILIYDNVERPFMLAKLGQADDGQRVALILENVEAASWPPPWTDARLAGVGELLQSLRSTAPPKSLSSMGGLEERRPKSSGWPAVAEQAEAFLGVGLVNEQWLDANIGALIDASQDAPLDGDALTHLDVRSDNICFIEGHVRLLDWGSARQGHPFIDQHYWATTLCYETGKRFEHLVGPDGAAHLALISGYLAHAIATAHAKGSQAGVARLSQALPVLLDWVCDLVGIEPPVSADI